MQQQQVRGQAQTLDRGGGGALQVTGGEILDPDLGGDEDVGAVDARITDALTDSVLIVVDARRVDVAVADAQGLGDHAPGIDRLQLPGAEPEQGDGDVIDGDGGLGLRHEELRTRGEASSGDPAGAIKP